MIRRQLFRAGLAVFAVLSLPLAASGQETAQGAAPLDPVAIAVELEGHVYLLRQGSQILLEPNTAVADSDEILTFPDGRVRLRFSDGSLVTIGPNSRCLVAFQRRAPQREGDFLQLIEGILRLLTAEGGADSIQVRTRSAIATPRGTEWIVERKPGTTAVFVIDGRVSVRGAGNAVVLLMAGEGTDVPDGAPPGAATRWGQARVDDVLARTTLP